MTRLLANKKRKLALTSLPIQSVAIGVTRLSKSWEGWYFSHSGRNWGFQCNLLAHARKGYRVVIMTHGSGGAGQVTDEIEAPVAAAYHWDSRQSAPPLDSPEDCLC